MRLLLHHLTGRWPIHDLSFFGKEFLARERGKPRCVEVCRSVVPHTGRRMCTHQSGLLYSVHCQMRYFPWAGNLSQSESTHQLSTRAELGQINILWGNRRGVQECARSTERVDISPSVVVCMCYPSHTAAVLYKFTLQCS